MKKFGCTFKLSHWTDVFALIVLLLFGIMVYHYFNLDNHSHPREYEVKANVHTIQIAIERYYTDHNEYPRYLLGGDTQSWGIQIDFANRSVVSNEILIDPLIEQAYVWSYPDNPFVDPDDFSEIIARSNTYGLTDYGTGDPRFGWNGNTMGNGLEDPNYFAGGLRPDPWNWSEVETRRTLDHGDWMNVPGEFRLNCTSAYYQFGRRRRPGSDDPDDSIATFWPGNFFYRAIGEQLPLDQEGARLFPSSGPYEHPQHYILGGYGSEMEQGLDVIRLESHTPDGEPLTWRYPESFPEEWLYLGFGYPDAAGSPCGLPAVFGGGDEWIGPVFPFIDEEGAIIYGAPDGYKDGVIIVLNDQPIETNF